MFPSGMEIEFAAYHRWERRGGSHGNDHEDWLVAEQDLLFARNYEVAAYYPLDGIGHRLLGRVSPRSCRFCERAAPQAIFEEPPLAVPEFLGNSVLISRDICDDCAASFRESVEADLERFTHSFRGGLTPRSNGESARIGPFGTQATHRLVMVVPTRPFVPIAVFKGFARMALAIMPEGELQAFEDAIEWVGNPDHEFDARVFHGLDCTLHVLPAPHPTPWIALARRTNPEATVPFMLFFLGTGRVVYQLAVPLCVRDEDLDGQDVLTPRCASPLGLGQAPDATLCAVADLSTADVAREARLRLVFRSGTMEWPFASAS